MYIDDGFVNLSKNSNSLLTNADKCTILVIRTLHVKPFSTSKTEETDNMSIFFEAAISRFIENNKGFAVASAETGEEQEIAVLTDGSSNAKIVYSPEIKRFMLFKGKAGCTDNNYSELQSYLFEPTGDEAADVREAYSVANEFTETFSGPAPMSNIPEASRKLSKKERESDESSAVYFVNRIPTVLPECREPLLMHKEFFDMLLPNKFCEEVVVSAVARLLSDKSRKAQTERFFEFLNKMYDSGDMDVKSIITMTILNSITGEERIGYVESLLSDTLKKSWKSARKFIGKTVKPEKESKYKQMSQQYRSQLMQNMQK